MQEGKTKFKVTKGRRPCPRSEGKKEERGRTELLGIVKLRMGSLPHDL
jgi:hypothetical protein